MCYQSKSQTPPPPPAPIRMVVKLISACHRLERPPRPTYVVQGGPSNSPESQGTGESSSPFPKGGGKEGRRPTQSHTARKCQSQDSNSGLHPPWLLWRRTGGQAEAKDLGRWNGLGLCQVQTAWPRVAGVERHEWVGPHRWVRDLGREVPKWGLRTCYPTPQGAGNNAGKLRAPLGMLRPRVWRSF